MGQHKLRSINWATKYKSIQTMMLELKLYQNLQTEAPQLLALKFKVEITPTVGSPKGTQS